ncbi:MrcB family domain-containing protein [Paenibacillus sp.]|uniref:MrcB family domain-containing protein n=1 Tax=Paenibacillus sp. TaxID=58172 RepID=UPI0028118070|nr:DUF3578 domain-containing protein [Paenibacillus sp.]
MSLPKELSNIFTSRQKSYKMVLVLSLLIEMNISGKREVSFVNVRERFLSHFKEREESGRPVDQPPNGFQQWVSMSPSQVQHIIITPINALSEIIEYIPGTQTIGFNRELYESWDNDVIIELSDYANHELERYYQSHDPGEGTYSIRDALTRILTSYEKEKREPFKNNEFGAFVRREVPNGLRSLPFIHDNLQVQASVGQGNWVTVPWIAIMDRRITTSTQRGEYIVYLFVEDMSSVYLTLAQGVTEPQKSKSKTEAYRYLRDKARELRELLPLEGLHKDDQIHLASGGLGRDYQVSTVAYYKYERDHIPDDVQLENDLKNLVDNYSLYVDHVLNSKSGNDFVKPAFPYTIARLHMFQGILKYLSDRSEVLIEELVKNQDTVLKSGDEAKHPKERVTHLGRALQEFGFITISEISFQLTDVGNIYTSVFLADPWKLSGNQIELFRNQIKAYQSRLTESVKRAIEIVKELSEFTLEEFTFPFITALGMAGQWNEVTQRNRSIFMLNWLEDLHFIKKEGRNYYWLNDQEEGVVLELTVGERLQRINAFIKSKGFNYPTNMIENFYLSLKTKPFTILAGISGTGKTKLIKLFAEAVGATEENGQFVLIPVRPDWSDPADLIGYTDLSMTFRPGKLTELILRASEPENKEKPYFLCLDEMNLARVEHYFSDILSILETQRWKDGRIVTDTVVSKDLLASSLNGAGETFSDLMIPENLFIVGTVNMDETTHPFSKKVLDRANTIEFNFIQLASFPDFELTTSSSPVPQPSAFLRSDFLQLIDAYAEHKALIQNTTETLVGINEILEEINAHVGFRVRDAICYYLIYNDKFQLMPENDALDFQILQKILPRIQGTGQSVLRVLLGLLRICTDQKKSLEDMLMEPEQYYQQWLKGSSTTKAIYPQSARKIAYMIRRLEEHGFTSFWVS